MTLIVGSPKFQAFDNNGNLLNGGKVYSYTGGTLIAKATYPTIADANAGTNANTNPVVLDSRAEANIVVNGDTKLILKDSNDNTLWTFDHLDVTSNDIIDNAGKNLLTFTPVASAVNYFNISNAISGSAPILNTTGTDSNVGMTLTTKGTGAITLNAATTIVGAATLSSTLAVTGTSTLTGAVTAPANFTNHGLLYPTTDGSVGQTIQTNGSGTLSFAFKINTINRQVFTSGTAATYTPTTGTRFVDVVVVGGGGSGGGASAGGAQRGIGSGGGAGGVCRRTLTIAQVGATGTYTVGAGGASGTTTGNNGSNSSIAFTGTGTITMTANGGTGGAVVANYNSGQGLAGAAGGSTSGGDSSSTDGGGGGPSLDTAATGPIITGCGGSNSYGQGGKGAANGATTTGGNPGTGFGSGGSGAYCTASSTASSGAGAAGAIIITEYICS